MAKVADSVRAEQPPRARRLARAIRRARGAMTQMEFVAYANRPQSVVSNWETGRQTPSLETLCALEQSLGLPLGVLAAQAGYFTAEGALAASLPGMPVSTLHFERRSDAELAVGAADALGLGVRMSSTPSSGWLVEIFPD